MTRRALLLTAAGAAVSFAVTVPRPAGDVPFTIPGKGPDNLSNYKGKVVLVVLFITTCPHCQQTTQLLSKIQSDYKSMGLQIIELAFREDEDDAAIQKFVSKFKPNFPVGKIDGRTLLSFSQLTPEIRPTVPILFFVDRNGVVQGQYMNQEPFMEEQHQDENIRAKCLQLLGQGRPARPTKK